MSAPASELLSEASCYACYGPLSIDQLLTLALERRALLARNPSADTSAAALISYAGCNFCFPISMFDALELALLDQISQS